MLDALLSTTPPSLDSGYVEGGYMMSELEQGIWMPFLHDWWDRWEAGTTSPPAREGKVESGTIYYIYMYVYIRRQHLQFTPHISPYCMLPCALIRRSPNLRIQRNSEQRDPNFRTRRKAGYWPPALRLIATSCSPLHDTQIPIHTRSQEDRQGATASMIACYRRGDHCWKGMCRSLVGG